MCAEPIGEQHQHVVDLASRGLMCTCRPCYLLFTAEERRAALPRRARPVPVLRRLRAGRRPVGRAGDPGRAGVLLPQLGARPHRRVLSRARRGHRVRAAARGVGPDRRRANPVLRTLAPDVEALIVRMPDRSASARARFLVPIDRCYELVGALRLAWRGFDGGQEARALLDAFFADLAARRPVGTAAGDG